MLDLLPLVLVMVVVAAATMALFLMFRGMADFRRARLRKRIEDLEDDSGPLLAEFTSAKPKSWSERMDHTFQQMIQRTGLGWTAEQALGLMALTGVALAAGLLLWRDDLWLFGIGLLVGLVAPFLVYLALQTRWRRNMQDQLPDAYFLLARSLRAGLSLEMALATVAESGNQPLADEFRRAVDQTKLGLSVPTALQGMANRIRLTDFDVFVTVVTLHRNLGGNLAQLLDRTASSTRDRNLFRGYFRAATALGRLTAFFIAGAAPLILLGYAVWQPEFITRFTASAIGMRALAAALALEIFGVCWLYLLLRVDY